MSNVPKQYREMLRNALKEEKANGSEHSTTERPLKRAKRLQTPVQRARELRNNPPPKRTEEHERYVIHLSDNDEDNGTTSKRRNTKKKTPSKAAAVAAVVPVKQEIIDLSDGEEANNVNAEDTKQTKAAEESEEDEDIDSDDFEDVVLEDTSLMNNDQEDESGDLNITIKQHREVKKATQRTSVVSKEGRIFRRVMHLMHLFIMVGHGVSRNDWLSDSNLLVTIQKQIPENLKLELKQYQEHRIKTNVTSQSKTRKLLDFLRHLMEYWQKLWTIDFKAPVLYKKTWTEIRYPELIHPTRKQKITKQKFKNMILTHTGSRDIAAQGFVALLRSLNLPARLVFSIQPPDFTNMKKYDDISTVKKTIQENQNTRSKSPQLLTPTKSNKGKSMDRILAMIRSKKAYTNHSIKTSAEKDDEYSERYGAWPVFWVEIWDKDAKKYITIDPVVKKLIEVVSWKSKLEPPMNCIRNNAWYVVGYDRVGGVRDITRRYAKEYNAKIRKKRITREPKWEKWWISLLLGACSEKRIKDNRVDKFEQIEFEELELKEGMPANVGDFKGHPVYVLEKDLKYNEILMPKISCGGVSKKGKVVSKAGDNFIPVYKRSNVHSVRSARGWFMKGRVLKVGERPLKIRPKKVDKKKGKGMEDDFQLSDNEDEDEDDGRLYAESQTELYVPPPVVNGIIPKNAFKNIDVYEPWMIPEGCVHIRSKVSDKAARLMGIEYAPAVVGFDFTGSRRDASAKIEGIVTFKEYQEAVELICQGLSDMEEDDKQRKEDLINLRAWRILLTKLKINKRLLHEHGEIEDSDKEVNDNEDETGSESEDFETGGFVLGNRNAPEPASNRTRSHYATNEDNDDEIMNRSDLSASDFESDIEGMDVGGFSIKQIDNYQSTRTKARKKEAEKSGIEPVPASSPVKSMFDTGSTGLMMDDGELVYNPDGDDDAVNVSDSFDDENDDDDLENVDKGDDRMDQLDAEFADFMDDMEDTESKNDAVEDKVDEESGNEGEDLNNNEDEDYEFEYSD